MQNDPKKKAQGQGNVPRRSYTGKSAAERRAERRGETSEQGGESASRSTGTAVSVSASGAAASSRDRKAEREREKRRRQRFSIGIGAIVTLVIVVVLILYLSVPDSAPVPDQARTRYQGLPASTTEEGYPRLGNATAAVQVALYTAFDCTECKTFYDGLINPLIERVRNDQVAVSFVPLYQQGTIPNGQGVARAAICAGEQGMFWPFAEMVYSWQGQFADNLLYRNQRLTAGVNEIGLNGGTFDACRGSSRPDEVLDRARSAASSLSGFGGAPTVSINGVVPLTAENVALETAEEYLAAIDAEIERVLSGVVTPDESPAAESTAEPEATPEAEVTAEAEATPAAEAESTPAAEATEPAADEAEATEEAVAEPTPDAIATFAAQATALAQPTAEPTPGS